MDPQKQIDELRGMIGALQDELRDAIEHYEPLIEKVDRLDAIIARLTEALIDPR